jgi:predicted amidophosphoribosyltransferase
MGWGHIGLSWTRYAKSTPTRNCERCHLDYPEAEDSCPHCAHIEDHALQEFRRELDARKQKSNILVVTLTSLLLLYAVIVLIVLPVYMD